jgi:predicted TIM-barrel fold metal-dependent hydrolase
MMFFDANVQIGTPMNGALEYASTTEALLREMDRNGVAKALVRDVNLTSAGAVYANNATVQWLAADTRERLAGAWSFLPSCTHELPDGKEFFTAMKANRIKALIPDPAGHRWIPDRLSIGKFMDEAAERRIPVMIGVHTLGSWEAVYAFLKEFPRNRYICMTHGLYWGTDRYFRPLLENYPGFHLEISTYWVPEGVTDLVNEYGAERVLYGSGYPGFMFGGMMLSLKHSDIGGEAKRLIAGANLQRLLDEVEL